MVKKNWFLILFMDNNMTDFSQQIANFTNYGVYHYKFDEVGNEILNPHSTVFQQVYFSIPLDTVVYNNSKIMSFYDPTFTEFVPAPPTNSAASVFPQEAIDEINAITYQNVQLQSQLDSLIATSTTDSSSADMQSVRNTIINLRTQLGQGIVDGDFQTAYPYLPLSIEEQNPPPA
jgi:hypothetical protein